MVRMVSSSAGDGPGPLISRGFTERRIFRRSMASGTAVTFSGMIWDRIACDAAGHEAVHEHFRLIVTRDYCLRPAGAGAAGVPGTQLMLPIVLGPYWTKPVTVVGVCGAEIGRERNQMVPSTGSGRGWVTGSCNGTAHWRS